MKLSLVVVLCLLCHTVHAAASRPPKARQFHVAPGGDDGNPGTAQKPFATLGAAQAATRKLVAGGWAELVTIHVHGDTYFLTEPLTFGPQDASEGTLVTYAAAEGETAVISGGRRISGWKEQKNGTWTVMLPPVKAGQWSFRNLWVNGRRATRARHPNPDDEPPRLQLQGAKLTKDLNAFTLTFPPDTVKDWANPSDIEVLVDGNWAINRKRVESIDAKTGTFTMAPPHRKTIPWNQPRKGRWCTLENSPDFLDQPGEWYLDRRSGVLRYRPRPGEDMARAEIIAPVLTRLLEVKGTKEAPVRNLHFVGLSFAHTDWQIPDVGYFGVQACHHVRGQGKARQWARIPCAVRLDYAQNCSVRNGAIAHLGTGGIELVEGVRDCAIEGNAIGDISANGVMLGGPKDEAGVPKDCRIASNHVHDCGVEYMGAVGIWVGFAQRAAIVHNRVHDLPYTGISLGWQWNPQPTPCKENTVAFNHIFRVMKHLGDGGGIYTLGFQPGTVIRGNHIHEVKRSRFNQAAPNNGMFIDQGSKGFLFEKNVIYATAHQPVRHNQSRPEWHTWKDNHFGGPAPAPGKIGTALLCDGSSTAVEVPHRPELEPQQLTVEAWIRLPEYPRGRDTRRWIANKNRNEWEQGHYALVIDRDKVGAYLNIGGGEKNAHAAWSEEGLIRLDTWHHAAIAYDGQELNVYLDGKPVASTGVGKPRQLGKQPFAIGARQDRYAYFKGRIDDVRVYARALPAKVVRAHASAPAPIVKPKEEPGLVGYWGFDDIAHRKRLVQDIMAKAGLEPPHRERLLGDK